MKQITLLIFILFIYNGVFNSPDLITSDRDEAIIISCNAILHLQNPYNFKTQLGNEITSGLFNIFIAIPFVYIFGNYQVLTFIFYLILICIFYNHKYFNEIVLFFICSLFLSRTMFYRLDELYWILFYIYFLVNLKSKWKYLFIIPIILSRNWFAFNYHSLTYNIDYFILIYCTSLILYSKSKFLIDN